MNLSDAIEAYIADRKVKGHAAATIRNDKRVLQLLLADVGNVQTGNLRPQHLDTFWAKRTTWGPGTMNRSRSNLSAFFKWCQTRGHISRQMELLEGHRNLRVPPRNRIIIPQVEFSTFLEGITNPRSRIIAALGLYLFVRISETRALRWQDFNLDAKGPDGDPRPTVDVFREKTQTLDTLPVCAELVRELKIWRLTYSTAMGQPVLPGWFVVPRVKPARYHGKLGEKGTFEMVTTATYLPDQRGHLTSSVTRILKDAGYYQPHEGGHTLRRSGAIALYNQLSSVGHDRAIRICQAMLGHASIATTELYLRLDLDRKVRNDLLAGKPMFPADTEATLLHLPETHRFEALDTGLR